ncbi:MAG: NAD(P)H-dependent oxidoreductase [Thermomicrobiales bacterium]|nr:NAD(P)H-dependent oxidoreductase [Thermomicrobiales bacterium]
MTLKLKIIVGSTREGRAADLVAPWVEARARAFGGFDVETLDLRDWSLPMFQETRATLGDPADPTYSDPVVKAWNAKIKEADVFIFITPEYNYTISGALKNAIDSVFVSQGFRNKVVLPVGYSSGIFGGARAVLALTPIALEIELHMIRNAVLIGNVSSAFADGEPTNRATDAALEVGLEDLAWWGAALLRARAEGQLPPGGARMQAKLQPVTAG